MYVGRTGSETGPDPEGSVPDEMEETEGFDLPLLRNGDEGLEGFDPPEFSSRNSGGGGVAGGVIPPEFLF